jgi:hypothetical protein
MACLGRAVVGVRGGTAPRTHAGDVDYPPKAAFDHAGRKASAGCEGSRQIDGDRLVPELLRHLHKQTVRLNSRVVHQDGDVAELPEHRVTGLLDARERRNIAVEIVQIRPLGTAHEGISGIHIDIEEDDRMAQAEQSLATCSPYSSCTTCDYSDAPLHAGPPGGWFQRSRTA